MTVTTLDGVWAGQSGCDAPTPSLYPIRLTRLHRTPAHYAEHRSYLWYVDVDDLPQLPRWLAPFARFEAADHLGDVATSRGRAVVRVGEGPEADVRAEGANTIRNDVFLAVARH